MKKLLKIVKTIEVWITGDCHPQAPLSAPTLGQGDTITMLKTRYKVVGPFPGPTAADTAGVFFNVQQGADPVVVVPVSGMSDPYDLIVAQNIPGTCWFSEKDLAGLETAGPVTPFDGTDTTPPPGPTNAPSLNNADTVDVP